MKAAFLGSPDTIHQVFAHGRMGEAERRADFLPCIVEPKDLDARLGELSEVEALFTTWGMPLLSEAQLDGMPKLRAVFYAAGAVGHFAKPLLRRGILVSSAWHANAIPVAEFVLSEILLACKGYFANVREYRDRPESGYDCFRGPGVFGETIALLGAGAIGSKLIELLRSFRLEVIVFDPFLSAERASDLGVERVSLEEAFERGYVVSNHLLDLEETWDLIHHDHFISMRRHATFINTGRGRTVKHDDLVEVFTRRPDLTALLDVTHPEPLPIGHPLLTMPNVHVTSHIAGSIGDETCRMADYAIEEFDRWSQGQPLRYGITSLT